MELKKENKKGAFFSLDAFIAVSILFLFLIVFIPYIRESRINTSVNQDIITTLSSLKVSEINNTYVQSLISQGLINDTSKSILEQIGQFYVENLTLAKSLADAVISDLDTNQNIGIWYGSTLIASKNSTSFNTASNIDVSTQTISGIQQGGSVTGFSARAYLSKSLQTKYFYFGGYVGDGNITLPINYNGNITSAEMELTINNNFSLYTNNNFIGNYNASASNTTPITYAIPIQHFVSGNNNLSFRGDNLYIAGGFVKIVYQTDALYQQPYKYYFPGINGLINIYDGFYIPNTLNSIKIYLHYSSNVKAFLNLGNTTIYRNLTNNSILSINLDNTYISSLLNYSSLANTTLPIRFGLENTSFISSLNSALDVFSVVSLPSSFSSAQNSSGAKGDVVSADSNRILAKNLLNNSFVRVGLIGMMSQGTNPPIPSTYYNPLTTNYTALNSTLNNWQAKSNYCLCCGISNATSSFLRQSNSSTIKVVIITADNPPNVYDASYCSGYGTIDPINSSINMACNVSKIYNITFDAIQPATSGNSVSQTGQDMLKLITNCSNGTYLNGSFDQLNSLYANITTNILQLTYSGQTATGTSNINSTIYPDSYIEFNYTTSQIPYGLIISLENLFSNNIQGNFSLPSGATIVEAETTSYSGANWTINTIINNVPIYNLTRYGSDYVSLGDPFRIGIPIRNINSSVTNIVKTETGIPNKPFSTASPYDKIIYKVVENASSYSGISSFAIGCVWQIQFEDNTNATISVPSTYIGANSCVYSPQLQQYDQNDAFQTAVYNLLKLLDLNKNNKIDIKLSDQSLQISTTQVKGIPFGWSTEVQVRTWN